MASTASWIAMALSSAQHRDPIPAVPTFLRSTAPTVTPPQQSTASTKKSWPCMDATIMPRKKTTVTHIALLRVQHRRDVALGARMPPSIVEGHAVCAH